MKMILILISELETIKLHTVLELDLELIHTL